MDETTGINSLTSDSSAKGEESGNIYSLDGRKVSNSGLSKGIYIKNGKKVVIKWEHTIINIKDSSPNNDGVRGWIVIGRHQADVLVDSFL